MNAIDLYNEARVVYKTGKVQREAFSYWASHNSNPVYETLAYDTETTGVTFGMPSILHGKTDITVQNICVFGISLCIPVKDSFVLVWARLGTDLFEECKKLVAIKGEKVAHRAQYDLRVSKLNDIDVKPVMNCTLTQARIVWNRRMTFDLKKLAPLVIPEFAGYDDDLKAVLRNIRSSYTRGGHPKNYCNYSFIPDEVIREYSIKDAFATWMLNLQLRPEIDKNLKEAYMRERHIFNIVMNIEETGVQFSRIRAKQELRKLQIRVPGLEKRLYRLFGARFNYASPKQLLPVLIYIGIPATLLRKKEKGGKYKPTTEKATLETALTKITKKRKHIQKFVDVLFELRSIAKLCNTYLSPLYLRAKNNHGIVYCNINPTDTRTGRMSSSGPNLQNIPRPSSGFGDSNPVRRCFTCRPGYTNFFLDYSQMEMWLFAILAEETRMLTALKAGADIHSTVSVDVYKDKAFNSKGEARLIIQDSKLVEANMDDLNRFKCKKVNFGIIYGMGFKALAVAIKGKELEGYDLRNNYLKTYPRVVGFMEENTDKLRTLGYVEDLFGRRYNLTVRNAYKATNCLVQGGCAQILKIALIAIALYLKHLPSYSGLRVRMILLIHDEIMIQVPNAAYLHWDTILRNINRQMVRIPQLLDIGIKLTVDKKCSTDSWESKQSYKYGNAKLVLGK